MSFLDDLLKKIKKPLETLPDWAKKSPVKVASEYLKPTSNQGQNFWSTKTAEKLGNIQQRHEEGGGIKQYFFPTAQGTAPETFRRYIGDTAKIVPEIAKSLPSAGKGLLEMTTPGLPVYRALTGQQEKSRQATLDVINPVLKTLNLRYRMSPAAPVLGLAWGAVKEARNGRPLFQAMKEEGVGVPSTEQAAKIIGGAQKGITEQPGFGEAFSDNPTTQTILNAAYLIGTVFGPRVYKNAKQKAAVNTEKEKLAKVLGIDKNASEEQAKAALREFALKWHPDKHIGKPTFETANQKMAEFNMALKRFEELGFGTGAPSTSPSAKPQTQAQPATAADRQLAPLLLRSGNDPILPGIAPKAPTPPSGSALPERLEKTLDIARLEQKNNNLVGLPGSGKTDLQSLPTRNASEWSRKKHREYLLEQAKLEPKVIHVGGEFASLTPEQQIALSDETGMIPRGETEQVHISLERLRKGNDIQVSLNQLAGRHPDVRKALENAGIPFEISPTRPTPMPPLERQTVTAIPPKPVVDEGPEPFPWETSQQDIPMLGYKADQPPKPPKASTPESLVQSEIDERIARAEIAQEYGPKGAKKLLNRLLNPLKNAPEPVQQSANTWRKEILTARTDANALATEFADIPAEDGWKLVRYIENPTQETAKQLGFDPSQYQKEAKEIRQTYDQVRQEGIREGLDIGYIDNYMNHVWKESWGEIATKVRGAGARPYFTKERVIPSLEEGMKLGLTPRFTHPAQFAAHYKEALGKAVANKKLVDSLVKSDQLVPSSDAPLDWQPINAPLFPKVTKIIDGKKQIISDYKAPPNVAEAINSIFEYGSGQHSGLEDLVAITANISKRLQEVSLTGGVGPANAFTYGQVIKEITSGRVKSPVASFLRAWSNNSSKQFLAEKQPVIRMMNEEGVPVYHSGDYKRMFKNLAESRTLKQKLGDLWDKAFNEATFRRFMPMLEINFFEDTYNNALKNGLSEVEARKLAGEATKDFYGITDNFSRSKFVEDTLSTGVFAPTFRESMVNFWINNVKALLPKNLGDKAYNTNRKFLVGTVLTYVFFNAANKALTGHSMHENKGGKELSVEIPVGDDRSIYVPMLPSVGTLPRRAGEMTGALLEGDVATATQKAGSLASSSISLGSQLATNRTFYGAPIYQRDDPALTKIAKLGGYGLEQASPSYIGEPIAYLQGRKTPVETALGIMEAPAYPSSSTPEKPLPLANVSATQTLAASDNAPLASTGTQEKPSLLESLFSLRKKDESQELRPLPQKTGDLAVIFGEAQKILDNYEEKRVKTEYGQYATDKKRRDALAKLEEDRAYAQAVLERIKSERPEQLFEVGLETYASGAGTTVEERAKWAAGELSSVADENEFTKKLEQMLEGNVITKDVATALREEYGLPVYQYKSGGKIVSAGGTRSGGGSSSSTRSLSQILKAARQDAQEKAKLYESMTTSGTQPTALEAVMSLYGQGRATRPPTSSSLETILARKRKMEPIAQLG